MNSCILMAQVVSDPELRSTQDNLEVSYMMVEFEGLKAEEPPARIRVVGWGNLASEIKQKYGQGDRIIIEGRLSMTVVELPEGYKEKRAELIASRIYPMQGEFEGSSPTTTSSDDRDNFATTTASYQPSNNPSQVIEADEQLSETKTPIKASANTPTSTASTNEDWDDIPF